MANISGLLTLTGASNQIPPGQPVGVQLVLSNGSGSIVNLKTWTAYATSGGLPSGCAVFGNFMTPGGSNGSIAIPAFGQLSILGSVVFRTPNTNPETGSGNLGASTSPVTITVTAYTDDNAVTSASMVVTPVGLGGAIAASSGQFVFSSPVSSPNYFFFA